VRALSRYKDLAHADEDMGPPLCEASCNSQLNQPPAHLPSFRNKKETMLIGKI